MPKILITGNGFDIHQGLPTRYSDFINILNSLFENERIDFESVYEKCSDYERLSNTYKSFEFDEASIDKLLDDAKENPWYLFFKEELRISTWIDFENRIDFVLKELILSIEDLNRALFNDGSVARLPNLTIARVFKGDVVRLNVLRKFKLINLDSYENAFPNELFLIKRGRYFVEFDLDYFFEMLQAELKNFKKIFCQYFELFVYPLFENRRTQIDSHLFSKIDKHYTFNYTPTFEKVFNIDMKTDFLHGKADSSLNRIVLGVNEISNNKLDGRYLIPFTKGFQKLDLNTDYNFFTDYADRTAESYVIFFFGHSLDTSDKSYIDEVFEFFKTLHSKENKIVIIYHNDKSRSQLLNNLIYLRGEHNISSMMKANNLELVHLESEQLKTELLKGGTAVRHKVRARIIAT